MIVARLCLALFTGFWGFAVGDTFVDLPVAVVVFAIAGLRFWINRPKTRPPCVVVFAKPRPKAADRIAGKRLVRSGVFPLVARLRTTSETVGFAGRIGVKVRTLITIVVDAVDAEVFGALFVGGALGLTVTPKQGVQALVLADLHAPFAAFVEGLGVFADFTITLLPSPKTRLTGERLADALNASPHKFLVVAIAITATSAPVGIQGADTDLV